MLFLKEALVNVDSPTYLRVNNFLALVTLISVLFIVLETVASLTVYETYFRIVEWTTVAIFTVEYIARLVVTRKKLSYIFSFYGLIDLVAVLPTYLGLANLNFLKTARITRILRFLRMVRLVKVMRTRKQDRGVGNIDTVQRISIQIYLLTLTFSVVLFGTLIYLVEGSNPAFANIPLSMMWATKLTLGGISQVTPATVVGELISIGTRFVGLLLFGLLIHIIGKFTEKLLLGSAPVE